MIQELMFLLADEAEAVKGYLKVLEKVTDEETKSVLQEIVDDEYKTLDDYINATKKIVADREKNYSNVKADFEKELKNYNMSFKEFYKIMQKYNNLSYTDRINYEKENGLYKGWL